MSSSDISHEFDGNVCELTISLSKAVQYIDNCDIFVNENNFVFIADIDLKRFNSPRLFDTKDMKNIPISYNSERRVYTCRLPCYPSECIAENIEKGKLDEKNSRQVESLSLDLTTLSRITDSCILTVDGVSRDMKTNFPYGFAGRYRGSHRYCEADLSVMCRITNPSIISPIRRTIQRETDESKDFNPDQYKLNFVELQIADGHEDPMKYTISFDDTTLTEEEGCILHNITAKDFVIKLDVEQISMDCGLISILLAICYDVRCTSNDLNCESAWTRIQLSSCLSYFERFENLNSVVDCFLRRSLIYPLYRNYDLGLLCVDDAVEALQKGKAWIVKQLLGTYCCFSHSDPDRTDMNKFFIKDYIRYVAKVLDNNHLLTMSKNLKNVLLNTNKKQLQLNLGEIETELLKELIEDIHLTASSESDGESESSESETSSSTESNSEDESGSVIEKKILNSGSGPVV